LVRAADKRPGVFHAPKAASMKSIRLEAVLRPRRIFKTRAAIPEL